MTWICTVEAETTAMGHSWGTLRTLAQDCLRRRDFVAALVVYGKKGNTLFGDHGSCLLKSSTMSGSQE